ncbi:MAG: hypothetical protein K0U98_24355 [Deltaproteobacteria bacterium]|nr:hypothetical protein [Deltaproteobacteria bacterium]
MKRKVCLVLTSIAYCWVPLQITAGPTVVPTAEGQIGEVLDAGNDNITGISFESIRGQPGDILFGGLVFLGGAPPGPPEFSFSTDEIHNDSNPVALGTTPALFTSVTRLPPRSSWSRNAADDGDFVAFAFASDDLAANSMRIDVKVFNEVGQELSTPAIPNLVGFPDPAINDLGVATDREGRVTVAYTELTQGQPTRVRAQRFDGLTGLPIGGVIPVSDDGHAYPDVALLDPAGDLFMVPTSDFDHIRGNIVDVSGPTPVVMPEFSISTTPGFANFNPKVAADPQTGISIVVWENLSAVPGNPADILGRRFDADGNELGPEFVVNTTTANAQGQPAVAVGPDGLTVVSWTSEPGVQGNELDVMAQVYGADGNPIGGEIQVNTETDGVQDKPAVRFLPESDSQGRPQFTVAWRDVNVGDGSLPNGTGTSYKCFSIEGLGDPTAIFADGFESGDTSSWSDQIP